MMTVYEYASDMNKTVSEILNLCKKFSYIKYDNNKKYKQNF